MASRDDPRYNRSGYLDLTAYYGIELADRDKPEVITYDGRIKKLIKEIHKLAHDSGFEVEGRIALKDKETGKIWR